MLIESQAQKVLTDQKKVPDEATLMDVDESEPVSEDKNDSAKNESDIEMRETNSENPSDISLKKEAGELDEFSSMFSPTSNCFQIRSFCKLGHFHLLLEDYAKGKKIFSY